MHAVALLLIGFLGGGTPSEYSRSLSAKSLDQPTLDAEGYGEKNAFKREDGGLRITLAPGEKETGWKTPPQIRFGGDFKITANLVIGKLPKPAQEDGAAVGVAIAQQDINQPDLTLLRLREPTNADVYRSVAKAMGGPGQMMMPGQMMGRRMMMNMGGFVQPGEKPPKAPRSTFPAAGEVVQFQLEREGNTVRFQVVDVPSGRPRYLGQTELGANDIAAVKLFASNRNGAEPINVLWRDITIQADRINGLGTIVRTVFGEIVYADPTSIENGVLVLGGQPKAPFVPAKMPDGKDAFKPLDTPEKAKSPAAKGSKGPAKPGADTTKVAQKDAAPEPTKAPSPAPAIAAAAPPQAMVAAPLQGTIQIIGGGINPAPPTMVGGPPPTAATAPPQQPPPQKPKAKIPLDELESIRFERTPALAARFIGQPNLDFTMPGLSAKKDDAKPKVEPKKDDTPKAETKKDAAPKAETKKDDKPKAEAKKNAAPKAEAKKDDKPKAEAKKNAAPKAEAKKDDAKPKAEAKKDDKPKAEAKKTDGTDDALAPPPGTTITKFPKLEPKKNGIRDINLSLFGLREAKIKQITVMCQQTEGGPTSWRLDTTDSQDWPLVVRRAGTDLSADLFLEPPRGDSFQKNFMVAVIYEDGQNANATVQAAEHTDSKLAVDLKAPAVPGLDATVHLMDEEKLFGKFEGIGPETLKLTTPWQDHLEVPLARVIGVHFGLLDRKESPGSFANRLKARGSEDLLLAQTKDGEVVAIAGIVEGTEKERLRFTYQGRERTLPLKLVEGLILASRPDSKPSTELRPSFTLPGGVVVSGRWKALDTSAWKIVTAWGEEVNLPAADVQGVKFRGGKMTYLSDLNPSKVEETPFFGRRLPWRRNVNLLGEPLKMNGQTYDRGVAVHSRCNLTYDLNREYSTFEALVGFDEAGKGLGRVDCRVFADGKEIYSNPDLRADSPPVKLSLPVAGAEQLRLLVDFGRGQDTGDRVIFANARLHR